MTPDEYAVHECVEEVWKPPLESGHLINESKISTSILYEIIQTRIIV